MGTLADMGNPSLDVGRKLEPEELLQRLPDKVLKNGQVIDIRGGVRKALGMDQDGTNGAQRGGGKQSEGKGPEGDERAGAVGVHAANVVDTAALRDLKQMGGD